MTHINNSSNSIASSTCHDTSQHGYTERKEDYLKRLRRIEGQARGIQRMVDEDEYCIDILTQVSAMTKALQAVALGLVRDHIGSCVIEASRTGGDVLEHKLDEVTLAISRFLK